MILTTFLYLQVHYDNGDAVKVHQKEKGDDDEGHTSVEVEDLENGETHHVEIEKVPSEPTTNNDNNRRRPFGTSLFTNLFRPFCKLTKFL